ncbi:phage tail tip lysozyme [Ensifer adhaerens]|uniref:phage tail tip lysozyme n=1 Tax=Ensifer adhaerens TaxID=106592 RepID=UPI003D0260BC
MAKQDKPLNSMGLPVRIQSVREATKYFDENPALTSRTPIADAKVSRGEAAQFRHPLPSELMSGDFRKAPMHFRGTLTDTTRFSKEPEVLPTDRLKPITAHDKLSDNIALRMKRDLQQRLLLREHEAAGFVGNGDHESGGFGALRGNLWQHGYDTKRDEGNALGTFQWDGMRREDLRKWADENGYDDQSIEELYEPSYGFLEHELTNTSEGKVLKELDKADTADDAARIVEKTYLRSGNPRLAERQKLARRAMGLPDYTVEIPVPMRNPNAGPPWSR